MKTREIEIDGEIVKARFENIDGRLWIHARGLTWDIGPAIKASRSRSSSAGGTTDGNVRAPMPGKLVKISVKVGEQVAVNQVVAVMEAMKMEYTLKAAAVGVVTEIKRDVGSQVALDELLIAIDIKK